MNKPLILAGFMGAGKTTIGQRAAQRLGYEFIDTDDEIERREGLSIPLIFERRGEAHFRAGEAALVRELVERRDVVIATGGGMVVDDANRRALLDAGVVVCLTAAPEAILRRVDAATRPMLRGDDPRTRVAHLLKARAPAYAELHYHVDTTHRQIDETVQCVLDLYQAERDRIAVRHPSGRYDIVIGENIAAQIGFALAARGYTPPLAIVSDEHVGPLYAGRIQHALDRAGIASFVHLMHAGEAHKTLHNVEQIYQALAANGLERGGAVIAVGGGVTGDVAGFAAATFLRGVPFVQVPTSLLAMADSSIGGKVGVDTSFGKNLVGAFKQPDLVVIDLACLCTLPDVERQCGCAEIVKAALIRGGRAWEEAEGVSGEERGVSGEGRGVSGLLQAILLKRDVVEEDPYEKGRRALLNLGHTFGHGIEAWSDYTIKHGQAVALGLVCAARLSRAMGVCDEALVNRIIAVLDAAGLPVSLPDVNPDAVWQLMQSDKKKRAGRLRFVLLRAPGDVFITAEVDEGQARQALASLRHAS